MKPGDEVWFIDENNWLCIVRHGILLGGTNYTEVQPVKSDDLDKMIIVSGLEDEPLYMEPYTILDDDRCLPRTEENSIKLLAIAAELNVSVLEEMNKMVEHHANTLANTQRRRAAMEKFIRMSNSLAD